MPVYTEDERHLEVSACYRHLLWAVGWRYPLVNAERYIRWLETAAEPFSRRRPDPSAGSG